MSCNGVLEVVDKAEIADQLPAKTADYYDEFRRCQNCRKIYWRGSHYEQMDRFIDHLLQARLTYHPV